MFEWDEAKRLATLEKHRIDFVDAVAVFDARYILLSARSEAEERRIAVGPVNGVMIAVIFTMRGESRRIVTARRARRDERREYQAVHGG